MKNHVNYKEECKDDDRSSTSSSSHIETSSSDVPPNTVSEVTVGANISSNDDQEVETPEGVMPSTLVIATGMPGRLKQSQPADTVIPSFNTQNFIEASNPSQNHRKYIITTKSTCY